MEKKLPEGWKWKTIENVCIKVTDGSHFTPKFVTNGYPFVMISNIGTNGIEFEKTNNIDEVDFNKLKNNCNPRKGDVLFTKDGTVGKVLEIQFDKEYIVLSSIAILRPDPKIVLSKYLRFVLANKHFLEQAMNGKTGTGLTRLILKNLKTLSIPIPPIETQIKITAILDKSEETKRLRAQSNEFSQKLLQSVFFEMFGDPEKNPKKWNIAKLKDISEFVTDGDHNPPKRVGSGIPHISGRNIVRDSIDMGGCSFISDHDYHNIRARYEPRERDVLMTCVGTIGRTAIVGEDTRFSMDRDIIAIRVHPDILIPEYLNYYLKVNSVQAWLAKHSKGGAQLHIYLKDVREMKVLLPPIGIQSKFLEFVRGWSDLKKLQIDNTNSVQFMMESINQMAFSGELVV